VLLWLDTFPMLEQAACAYKRGSKEVPRDWHVLLFAGFLADAYIRVAYLLLFSGSLIPPQF
jgi:hypothetical protein